MSERAKPYERTRQQILDTDPDLRLLIDGRIEAVAMALGESPEAWRGAEVVADELVGILGTALGNTDEDEMQRRAMPMLTFTMCFAVTLGLHPMTPWGRGEAPR